MSVNAHDFVEWTIQNCSTGSEIEQRIICSRIYYGAFHLAVPASNLCPDNSHLQISTHVKLAERFKSQGTNGAKGIAYVLESMKKIRVIADYEIQDPFDENFHIEMLNSYNNLNDKLTSFMNSQKSKATAG